MIIVDRCGVNQVYLQIDLLLRRNLVQRCRKVRVKTKSRKQSSTAPCNRATEWACLRLERQAVYVRLLLCVFWQDAKVTDWQSLVLEA